MSDSDAAPSVETPIVDRSERGGNVTLLVTLALSLVAAAGTFALLDRTLAEREHPHPCRHRRHEMLSLSG